MSSGELQGRLTTHVLDTATGRPAAGMRLELFRIDPATGDPAWLTEQTTNAEGRTDAALLTDADVHPGTYEIRFHAGDYQRGQSALSEHDSGVLFLDIIPIRFGIAQADAHYHVPLLFSPFGYSTYRGS